MQCIIATDGDQTYVIMNYDASTFIFVESDINRNEKAGIGLVINFESYKRINKHNNKANSLSIHKFVGNTGKSC